MAGSAGWLRGAVLVHVGKALVLRTVRAFALMLACVRVAFVMVLVGMGMRLMHELARLPSGAMVGDVIVFVTMDDRRVRVLLA